jgi:hypothetical protein
MKLTSESFWEYPLGMNPIVTILIVLYRDQFYGAKVKQIFESMVQE